MSGSPNPQTRKAADKTLQDAMDLASGKADRIWVLSRWLDGPSARVWFEINDHVYSACELEWEHGGSGPASAFPYEIEPLLVDVVENDLWAVYAAIDADGNVESAHKPDLCLATGARDVISVKYEYDGDWIEASDRWINRLNERLAGEPSTGSITDRQIDEACS